MEPDDEADRKRWLFEKFLRQEPSPVEELMALEDPVMAGAIEAAKRFNDGLMDAERRITAAWVPDLTKGELNGIFAKAKIGAPRFTHNNPPSIVDRVGSLGDPGLAKQIERYDRTQAAYAKVRRAFNERGVRVPDGKTL